MSASFAVVALVALASQTAQSAGVAAEPAGSNGQQLAENSIGGQASAFHNSEYSNLVGVDSSLGLDLGQRPFRNAKRARKMSAFMPMRGRKDGRDDQLREQQFEGALTAVEEQQARLQQLLASRAASQGSFREPSDEDASIMRLVSARVASAGVSPGDLGELVWRGQPTPAPRQFLARHLQQHQQLQRPEVEGGEGFFGLASPMQPARMQAKLRRAFHPMRGKKADVSFGLFADQDEPESNLD